MNPVSACTVAPALRASLTPGARIQPLAQDGWRLEIPAGPARQYRLAQLDNYTALPRRRFPAQPPLRLSLKMRACQAGIPGTWGVGLWNDPFSLALFSGAEPLRLPALPQAAWFFFASDPNYLSLRDDQPAQGGLAGVFASPSWPPALNLLALPALPLLLFPLLARQLRRLARRVVRQSAAALPGDPTDWREYTLEWHAQAVRFWLDGLLVHETSLAPRGPLGLVVWVDNQFLAFPPDGRLRLGALACAASAWIEVKDLRLE